MLKKCKYNKKTRHSKCTLSKCIYTVYQEQLIKEYLLNQLKSITEMLNGINEGEKYYNTDYKTLKKKEAIIMEEIEKYD